MKHSSNHDDLQHPSFEQFYVSRLAYVGRLLRRLGVPEKDVEDLTQEVFVIVHRQLPLFEGRSSVETWLQGVCRNVVRDFSRRAARRETSFEPIHELKHSGSYVVHALVRKDERRHLTAAIDTLAPPQRSVFEAFTLAEVPMKDISTRLKIPLQTAYARLYAAKRAIEQFLLTRGPRATAS